MLTNVPLPTPQIQQILRLECNLGQNYRKSLVKNLIGGFEQLNVVGHF